jgi:CubicO group peptidase (beta-lactamase class C family)
MQRVQTHFYGTDGAIRALIAVVVAGVLLLVAGDGPEPAGAAPPYDFSAVEASIQAQVDGGNFPGASLLLFKDGEAIYEHHFGTFGPTTTVPIASSTKWISGAMIMSLVDDGTISLDDTVSEYLPDWTGQKGTITIRQLFSHTSGLPADFACQGDLTMSLGQCVDLIRDVGLEAPPGSRFYYGGASMQVAGRIAEVATGQSWAQIFNERIRDPLGMTLTFYWPPANPTIGGGVVSRLSDYSKLLQMSLAGGEFGAQQVLSSGAIQVMEQDQTAGAPIAYTPHPDNRRYGIGVWRDVVSGTGQAIQVSSQGKFGMSPWLDRDRRYFGVFFVQDDFVEVYLLVAQMQAAVRAVIDAYDTDGDGQGDGADTDDDNDTWLDASDGCAIKATSWRTPIGDQDCDGYTLAIETYVGTNGALACSATLAIGDEPLPDAWPVDFNDNQLVNGADILAYNSVFGSSVSVGPPYDVRWDLNASGIINGADILQFNPFFGKRCAP